MLGLKAHVITLSSEGFLIILFKNTLFVVCMCVPAAHVEAGGTLQVLALLYRTAPGIQQTSGFIHRASSLVYPKMRFFFFFFFFKELGTGARAPERAQERAMERLDWLQYRRKSQERRRKKSRFLGWSWEFTHGETLPQNNNTTPPHPHSM